MSKIRLATAWLDGCSGCHMSILDMDERIIELAQKVDVVYSPYVDAKEYPHDVDLCLVEGAVATDGDRDKLLKIRKNTKIVISLGDCAVTGNVPAMRNPFSVTSVLDRAYRENVTDASTAEAPVRGVPLLLSSARPAHEHVKIDYHIPGCPPSADIIYEVLKDLLNGQEPDTEHIKFG